MTTPFGRQKDAKQEFNLDGVSVMLAMPVHRDCTWQTTMSLIQTQALFMERGIVLDIQAEIGGSLVEASRSKLCNTFLEGERSHMFWVDSDVGWRAEDFLRLVALATKMDVVAGCYPAKNDALTFLLDVDPWKKVKVNSFGCLPVNGLGLGFCCVQRHVITRLSGKAPKLKFPDTEGPIPHIFHNGESKGRFQGEDMGFFEDIRALGLNVFIDPTIILGHVGSKIYSGSVMDVLQKESESAAPKAA